METNKLYTICNDYLRIECTVEKKTLMVFGKIVYQNEWLLKNKFSFKDNETGIDILVSQGPDWVLDTLYLRGKNGNLDLKEINFGILEEFLDRTLPNLRHTLKKMEKHLNEGGNSLKPEESKVKGVAKYYVNIEEYQAVQWTSIDDLKAIKDLVIQGNVGIEYSFDSLKTETSLELRYPDGRREPVSISSYIVLNTSNSTVAIITEVNFNLYFKKI